MNWFYLNWTTSRGQFAVEKLATTPNMALKHHDLKNRSRIMIKFLEVSLANTRGTMWGENIMINQDSIPTGLTHSIVFLKLGLSLSKVDDLINLKLTLVQIFHPSNLPVNSQISVQGWYCLLNMKILCYHLKNRNIPNHVNSSFVASSFGRKDKVALLLKSK